MFKRIVKDVFDGSDGLIRPCNRCGERMGEGFKMQFGGMTSGGHSGWTVSCLRCGKRSRAMGRRIDAMIAWDEDNAQEEDTRPVLKKELVEGAKKTIEKDIKITFYQTGSTVCLDKNGEQIAELQVSWILKFVEFLCEKGINPEEVDFELPCGKASVFKVGNDYNWQFGRLVCSNKDQHGKRTA